MKTLSLLVMLSFCLSGFGAPQETIQFRGQEADRFDLDLVKMVTRYRTEYRDSTCTRQIPYVEQECGYETRYRQECRWQPGGNECRTEYETQCRTVTRYRRECTREPGRRVCRNTPPRQICRNGRCRTEPSRRICDTKPGREICRQVPYNERECTREPRRVCDRVPGRNVCDQVPYQEYVCRDVTRYRYEDYPCKEPVQIPYQVEKTVQSQVNVLYKDETDSARAKFQFSMDKTGKVAVDAKDLSDERSLILIKDRFDASEDDGNVTAKNEFSVTFFSEKETFSPLEKGITNIGLSETSLWFSVGEISKPQQVEIGALIVRDGFFSGEKVIFNKTISANDLILRDTHEGTKVSIDLSRYGIDLKKRNHEVTIEVKILLDDGIINLNRRNLEIKRKLELKVQ